MNQTKLEKLRRQEAALLAAEHRAWTAYQRAWTAYYAVSKRLQAMEEREDIARVRALPEIHRHAYVRHMERLVADMPDPAMRAKMIEEVARVKREVLAP